MSALHVAALAGVMASSIGAGHAADASAWDTGTYSSLRLISGSPVKTSSGASAYRAGIEIELTRGWKTYWRYPGDSGVPPRFDFVQSDNVDSVTVLWPAPVTFSDGSGRSVGYKQRVILPVHVVPREAGKPVRLRARIEYAVCEKLCVPVEAKVELEISDRAGAHEQDLALSETRVPRRAALGEPGTVEIVSMRRDQDGSKPRVIVDVKAGAGQRVELFAEGPDPDWALPIPEAIPGAAPDSQRFAFDLDGLPSGASAKGALIRLTAVAGSGAVEVQGRLD